MLEPSAVLLTGRVAIVTGGGAGIGRGIAETFAAHGARVVVAERDESRCRETAAAIEKRGGTALAQVVDVETAEGVDAMVRDTLDAWGRIDSLVNNVGDYLAAKPFVRSDEADWDALYSVNLKHVFACCRAAVPHMIERGEGGSIVNVSTIEAFRGIPNCAVYSAFNAGITGFTKSLALELGPFGIRVNAIAPETTESPQVPVSRMIPEKRRPMLDFVTPLGRFGTPDDQAGAALFLASDLSSWVTGTTVHVDGGALAAGGFYRDQDSRHWTNMPIVRGAVNRP
jgi:NAD(P)-dependent dehydrogenase (short-subunit alcohol dehydrogenase family)